MDRKTYLIAGSAIAAVPLLRLLWRLVYSPSHPPLPPGPKRYPVIGNIANFPHERWADKFFEWQKEYGDMIYCNVLGTQIIICNSLEAAKELFVRRGNIYSGRANEVMHNVVLGWGEWNVAVAQPGQFHTEVRRVFRRGIGQTEMDLHDELIQEEAQNVVDALKEFQGDPWEVIYGVMGAIITRLAYGDSIYREHGKELANLNRETLDEVTRVSTQFWLVNFIPILHYLPDWLPLAFKKIGLHGFALQKRMRYWPWEMMMKHFEAGIAEPSLALEYIQKQENMDVVRDALGMMFSAGVDNTASALMLFIGHMLHHPEVQKAAQEELDRELHGHLPTFNDRGRLPYMDAVWRESVRLTPSTPLGIPHLAEKDDIYNGMFIPRGTMFWPNIGFMLRDPRIWDEPDRFKPERFLPEHNPHASSLPDVDISFGFGRRICPGQFLADRTNFTFAACLLKTYDILPVPGEQIPERYEIKDAIIQRPENLRCYFKPRGRD